MSTAKAAAVTLTKDITMNEHLRRTLAVIAVGALAAVSPYMPEAFGQGDGQADPIFGIKVPEGYRDWRLISVAREEAPLDDVRAILGNDIAISAYRSAQRSFPDGTIISRLAWSYVPSEANNTAFGRHQSFVAGLPKNGVQFMIKDSKKYASTGGWGFAHFNDGKPASEAVHNTCFACHQSASARDFVFTDYAP